MDLTGKVEYIVPGASEHGLLCLAKLESQFSPASVSQFVKDRRKVISSSSGFLWELKPLLRVEHNAQELAQSKCSFYHDEMLSDSGDRTETSIFKERTWKNERLSYNSLEWGMPNCLCVGLTLFCGKAVSGRQILSMWHHWLGPLLP